jgi:hypothetical protein
LTKNPRINFCTTKLIAVCNANDRYQQQFCRFFKKTARDEHCMFFVRNEFCDCPDARRNATASVTSCS